MSMKIQLRTDSVHISGYVNAVDRFSRPIKDKQGKFFIEKIRPGAFRRALESGNDIELKHNHSRVLDKLSNGSFTLKEDNIGLYFDGDVTDEKIIEEARSQDLVGWSFGFVPIAPLDTESRRDGIAFERNIDTLELAEVSIIDRNMVPCYPATSIYARAEDGKEKEMHLRGADGECEYYSLEKGGNSGSKEPFKIDIARRRIALIQFI